MLQALGQLLINYGLQDYTLPVHQKQTNCTTTYSNYFAPHEICTSQNSIVGFEPHPAVLELGICAILSAYPVAKTVQYGLNQVNDYNYDETEDKVDELLFNKQKEEIKYILENKSKILERNNNCTQLVKDLAGLSALENNTSILYYHVKEKTLNQINENIIRNQIEKRNFSDLLYLSNCCLTRFPSSLFSDATLSPFWKKLYILHIDNNHLTSLPDALEQCKALNVMNVSNNKLSSLPNSIGECKEISDFYCDGNQLTTLPDFIGEWKKLMFLRASRNKLSSLPDSIGKCTKLRELSVDNNQLTYLPKAINECKNLREIEIKNNKFNSMSGFPLGIPFMHRYSKIVPNVETDVETDVERLLADIVIDPQLLAENHKSSTTRKFG